MNALITQFRARFAEQQHEMPTERAKSRDDARKWPPRTPPGPKSLQWCREHISGFAVDEKQVQAAHSHAETVRDAVTGGVEAGVQT